MLPISYFLFPTFNEIRIFKDYAYASAKAQNTLGNTTVFSHLPREITRISFVFGVPPNIPPKLLQNYFKKPKKIRHV